jgi:hypothetical protein
MASAVAMVPVLAGTMGRAAADQTGRRAVRSVPAAAAQSTRLNVRGANATGQEYVGELANLPSIPFRVRVSGRDRTGAVYQRHSRRSFHAATVEVVAPQTVTPTRGQQTPVTVSVRSAGAPARLQIAAF